jgi:hypothetical protein
MGADEVVVAGLAEKFAELRPHLDERAWRLYLGSEARSYAQREGCPLAAAVAVVAGAAGASRATVAAGAGALADGEGPLPGRQRRPGAGRRKAEDCDPGLRDALEKLLEPATRGDPVTALTWTTLSLRDLERELAAAGHRCKKDAIARILHGMGYSLQGAAKVLEGSQHPDRNAQFEYINGMIAELMTAGDPVISVDGKKKEQLGGYWRAGSSWRPAGDPVRVRDHSFPDPAAGIITPYGIYDIAANRGFVSVGTSHGTAALAVNAIRLWWQQEGSARYPRARGLLVTCDAGGSNACSSRLWKHELALFAAEAGLEVTVCHFPPGTSKWNKIEHRLFCHVTRTWRGQPLTTAEDAVAGIAATTTWQGLKCTAVLDDADYPKGREVSDERMAYLKDRVLERHAEHGEWNYTVLPAPRPAPGPEPGPAPPGRVAQDVLNHPALTGTDPRELRELAATLEPAFAARREYRLRASRGRPTAYAPRKDAPPTGSRKLDVLDCLIALRIRQHLGLPVQPVAALLGTDASTVSHATSLTGKLIATTGAALPAAAPPPSPPRTPQDLLNHASAAGCPLTIPAGQYMPKHFKPRPSRNRDTPETAN